MSENINDFMKGFSELEEQKRKNLEKLQLKLQQEIEEKKKFEKDLQILFRKELKPKLKEIKTALIDFQFEFDEEMKNTQSDQISLQIRISRNGYPNLIINLVGNTSNKKIYLLTKTSNTSFSIKDKSDYEYSLNDLNADIFEKALAKMLTGIFMTK